jgi:hypothetical protein
MVEPRLCEVCPSEIPTWKSAGTTVCSIGCRFKRKDQKRQKAQAELKDKRKATQKDSVVFHSCLYYGGIDPFVQERCRCRKKVSEKTAKNLVAQGEAVDLDSRLPAFTGRAIVQIGKVKRTPRVPTLEKPHCERITEKPKRSIKAKEKTTEELKAAVAEDRAERFEEEKLRMEIYGELTASARQKWIVEVDADVYDAAKRRDWGRALFTNYKEGRTAGGIDVDRILGETENADRAA